MYQGTIWNINKSLHYLEAKILLKVVWFSLYLFCSTNQQQKYTARSYPERTGRHCILNAYSKKYLLRFPHSPNSTVTESGTRTADVNYCPCTHFNFKINPFKTNKCTALLISFTLHNKYPCVTLISVIDTGHHLGSMLIFLQTDTQNKWGPWA